jgi:hypothetical protein
MLLWLYSSCKCNEVQCGCKCAVLTWVSVFSNNHSCSSNLATSHNLQAALRFIREYSIVQLWLALGRYLWNVLSTNTNNWMTTDCSLRIRNRIPFQWIKDFDQMAFNKLLFGISPSNTSVTLLGVPEWPSKSCPLITIDLKMYLVHQNLKIVHTGNLGTPAAWSHLYFR